MRATAAITKHTSSFAPALAYALMENGVEEESKEIVYALEDCTVSTAEEAVYVALRSLGEEDLIARYTYELCSH